MLRVPIKEMLTSPARLLAVVISTYGMETDVNKIAWHKKQVKQTTDMKQL